MASWAAAEHFFYFCKKEMHDYEKKDVCPKKNTFSFSLQVSHNVSIHVKCLVAHNNGDADY